MSDPFRKMKIPEKLFWVFMLSASALCLLVMLFFGIQNICENIGGVKDLKVRVFMQGRYINYLQYEINNKKINFATWVDKYENS